MVGAERYRAMKRLTTDPVGRSNGWLGGGGCGMRRIAQRRYCQCRLGLECVGAAAAKGTNGTDPDAGTELRIVIATLS